MKTILQKHSIGLNGWSFYCIWKKIKIRRILFFLQSGIALAEARDLIGLIYPDNVTIRGTHLQTARINKIIESIYLANSKLMDKKKGQREIFLFVP